MNRIPTVFFGTHEFAATILEGLLKSPLIEVELIITQPERPVGRQQKIEKQIVKKIAESFGIKVEQPETLKSHGLEFRQYALGIVCHYGLLIPPTILNAPKYGLLNVHPSLLPKYRGPSPIISAIVNGDSKTGVTIIKLDEGMDTGPILLQKETVIGQHEMHLELKDRLAKMGVDALLEAIPPYLSGSLFPAPQDESMATITKTLSRDDGRIVWTKSAQDIYNLYRGLTPWPGVWTMWEKKRLKLLDIRPTAPSHPPGHVAVESDVIVIGCEQGSIKVLSLQLEGKKAMDAKTFLAGHKNIDGAVLN